MKGLISPRFQRLAKEGSWIIIGQVAAVGGALMMVRVLTEYLEPEQYGRLALGLTAAGLVNQTVMGGITAGIGRFYSIAAEHSDLSGYLRSSFGLVIYATIVVAALALVLSVGLFYLGYGQWINLVIAALLFAVLGGYNSILSGIQNAARQRAVVAFHSGFDAWLKILLALGVMFWLGSSSTAVLIGYATSSLLITISQYFVLRRSSQLQNDKPSRGENWGRKIMVYSWPFSLFGVFTWMQQASDRWALQSFVSSQEVGLYAVVFQLGYTPIGLTTGMAMAFVGPILYQRSGSATDPDRNASVHLIAWRITLFGLALTAVAFSLTLLIHGWLFGLMVASEYRSVSYLLPWLILAGGTFSAGQVLALKLMSEMKSAVMSVAKIVTAILGVGLNIYGASQFGIKGVAASLVAFSIIYFLWMAWLTQHPPKVINNNEARTS